MASFPIRHSKGNGDPERVITQFLATVTVPGGESFSTNNQVNMRNNQRMPPSEKALPSTSNLGVLGASSNNRRTSLLLQSPLNDPGTREEVRRARQEDLDNHLRVAQNNIVQLEKSSARPGRSSAWIYAYGGGLQVVEFKGAMIMISLVWRQLSSLRSLWHEVSTFWTLIFMVSTSWSKDTYCVHNDADSRVGQLKREILARSTSADSTSIFHYLWV